MFRQSASFYDKKHLNSISQCLTYPDLRHTCAVLSLKNGVDAKEVSQMLGHFRIAMTRQNYAPYLAHTAAKSESTPNEASTEDLREAANILDNLLKF